MASRLTPPPRSATALALGVLMLCLARFLAREAWSQADSDFVSYSKARTDFETYRKETKHPRQLTFNRMPGISPEYQVGPGDELDVMVVGLFGESQKFKVNADGLITIPYLGPVTVADLTTEEIENAIVSGLKAKDLITDPQVLVDVWQYEAKTMYVLGEVDRPGEYSVSYQMTLMDLVFIAGGIDYSAANTGFLHRRGASGGAPPWKPTQVRDDLEALERTPGLARQGAEVIEVESASAEGGSGPGTQHHVEERRRVLRAEAQDPGRLRHRRRARLWCLRAAGASGPDGVQGHRVGGRAGQDRQDQQGDPDAVRGRWHPP